MFKLSPEIEFAADCQLSRPGVPVATVVKLTFRHKGVEARDDWLKRYVEAAKGSAESGVLLEVVAGWDGIVDDSAAAVPFTPEAFAMLVGNFPTAADEVVRAYVRAMTESRAKN